MNGNDMSRGEKVFFFLSIVGIAIIVFAGDMLQEQDLLLPVVGLVFILAFGFFGHLIGKSWKKSDEEILDMENLGNSKGMPASQCSPPSYEDRKYFFFGSISVAVLTLLHEKQISPGSLIFSGIVLTAGLTWFLPAWIQKRRGKEGEPLFPKAKLKPEQLFYMLFSLVGTCFIIFWIYLILSNVPQMWWFSIPGFIIGAGVSRPLVAGLRILLRREKDPGEKHIHNRRDPDPWDRPDRKL